MVAYTKPQQRKKEESKQVGGERDKIKFIDLRFERWQVVGLRKARRRYFDKIVCFSFHYDAISGPLLKPSLNLSKHIASLTRF